VLKKKIEVLALSVKKSEQQSVILF